MADSGRLDELNRKFDENPRRYFAPLANEYRKLGNLERAIELCRAYLPQQPGHMSGYIVYGQALFDAGRGDQAAAIFQQALSIDPENVIALRYLGDIARHAGDSDAALAWYRRVTEIDPKNEEISLHLSKLSPGSLPVQPQPSPVPPPLQTVHPEPTPDADAVALGDLVHQPDTPQPVQVDSQDQAANLPSITEFLVSALPEEPPVSAEVPDVSHTSHAEEEGNYPGDRMDVPFVTETMADLYQQQGFKAQALDIYQRLAQESEEPRVREKAQQLEQAIEMERRSAAPAEEPLHTPPLPETQLAAQVTVRDFFAHIGTRRPPSSQVSPAAGSSLGELFSSAHLDASDINAAASLAGAYTSSR